MNKLILLKRTLLIVFCFFLALLVWANLKKPSLSDQFTMKPVAYALFESTAAIGGYEQQLKRELSALPTVTAVTVNTHSGLIAITYSPDATDSVYAFVHHFIVPLKEKKMNHYQGPVCPVPDEYVSAVKKVKSLFCFRNATI